MWLKSSVLLLCLASVVTAAEPNTREKKVRDDRARVEAEGFWMYNDLAGAYAKGRETGKPILVVLRCLPCEECVKLDDELVDNDPAIKPLLEKFVCVRIVGTNGLDLTTFQYDTDQSFAVFMLNADGTIYGRFGTRSHRTEWVGDVSLAGMAKALQKGLDLHADYPNNKAALAGKRGPAPEFASPEKYPALKDKFGPALNYEGDVVKSCIHCHQIGDAQRQFYRSQGKPIPEHVLFPYPHPKSIGLTLDPKECANVVAVAPGSPAAAAGFKAGDAIASLNGQPLVSMADVQWVLHRTEATGATVPAVVTRGSDELPLSLALKSGWRREDDISWRVSSWGLSRMASGGMRFEPTTAETRQQAGVTGEGMALKVKSAGRYGAHAAARNAGFREGDLIVSYDGRTDLTTEQELVAYAVTQLTPGQQISVKLVRNGKPMTLKLPQQE
ncbi:MAG: PDZ domain-containing protein [Planctomycetaceae bacterium]|nr:PDZ domain-containing protein [Planctomycetaceae bacterium]